ncbi:hypothetical protein PYCC9005_003888 [Savitreella phatthalungensis]
MPATFTTEQIAAIHDPVDNPDTVTVPGLDSYEETDLVVAVLRKSRGHINNHAVQAHKRRPQEIEEAFYARYSNTPERCIEVKNSAHLDTVLDSGRLGWYPLPIEPVSSRARFLERNNPINSDCLELLQGANWRGLSVRLIAIGWDGIPTNPETFAWLAETSQDINFTLTHIVWGSSIVDHPDLAQSIGLNCLDSNQRSNVIASWLCHHDEEKDLTWLHYSVKCLASLRSGNLTLIELNQVTAHHLCLIFYLYKIDCANALQGAMEKSWGYKDKSFKKLGKFLGCYLASTWTRLGLRLPTANDRPAANNRSPAID